MNEDVARWSHLIVPIARDHRLAPSLILGLIQVESRGNPEAVSSAGAVGLCQVVSNESIPGRPSAAELLDPETNIRWGCRILAGNRERTGTQAGALAAYYGAANQDGTPNSATDGSSVDGWGYVRRVEAAALEYLELDQWADPDFLQYTVASGTWRDAATNLLGVATDALATGRQMRDDLRGIAGMAGAAADRWGMR